MSAGPNVDQTEAREDAEGERLFLGYLTPAILVQLVEQVPQARAWVDMMCRCEFEAARAALANARRIEEGAPVE